MHWLYHTIRHLLVSWGYWAVLLGVAGESAGFPLPGETVLLFASFLAHKGTGLHLYWIIPVGVGAATGGDNLGFLLGRKFGRHLLRGMKKVFRLSDEDVAAAKELMRRHGARTIYFARFIFGLRTVAGPLAGVLGMEWREFLLFNFLGAATWVTVVSMAGYLFANTFQNLLDYFETAGWILAAGLFGLGYFLWHRRKKKFKQEHHPEKKAA